MLPDCKHLDKTLQINITKEDVWKNWNYRLCLINTIFVIFTIYSIIELYCSNKLQAFYLTEKHYVWKIELFMVSVSTIMIIFATMLWIIPLFVYRPLHTETKDAVKYYFHKRKVG